MGHTISAEDLDRIVLDTLALFVGGNTSVEPDWQPEGEWLAAVSIDGGDPVRVVVSADDASARCIAGSMFAMAADLCGHDDVVDALGEVANTVGGNVKACLDVPGLALTLPAVSLQAMEAGPAVCRGYRCGDLGIAVALYGEVGQ